METIEALLHDVPLFEGLTPAELELIAGCGSNVRFREGELLFRDGDAADTFYHPAPRQRRARDVRPGPRRRSRSRRSRPARSSAGRGSSRRTAGTSTRARSRSSGRRASTEPACARKCESDPRLGYDLMSRFAQIVIERLQRTRLRLLDVYGYAGAD